MTTTEIRPEQRLTILKHLAGGKGIDVVASIIHLDKELVRQVGQSHGYPDREKLAWAVDVVEKNIEKGRTAALPQGTTPTPLPRPEPAANRSVAPVASTPHKPDEFRVLINTAKNHDRKPIQRLADKILEDLAKLRGLIDAEQEAFQTRQREAQEKAAAKAEVERLERALADAKAKLRGPAKVTSPKKASTAPKGDYPCRNDNCDKHYDTPQGRSLHERLRCEHRAEAAAS